MTETMPVVAQSNRSVATRTAKRDMLDFGTIAEVMQFAQMIQNAHGAIPKRLIGKPGEIVATVMAGHELGIGPMASLRAFHVVEGNPCAHYSFWVARLKAAGYRVEWPELAAERVTLKLTDPDGSSATETWTKARAITAGLWNGKDNWKKYPETMLCARAVTSLGRKFASEVMFCAYDLDEADEIVKDANDRVVTDKAAGGTAAERVAAAVGGNAVEQENASIEQKAKECVDMLRALGLGRAELYALLKDLGIEHTDKTRVSELSRESLEKLAERLDQEAVKRGDGGPPDSTNPRAAKAGGEAQREPGGDDA